MLEAAREVLAGQDAWIVGGAIRDELLGKPVLDLDIACRDPKAAAEEYAGRAGGAVFRLSGPHGAWRVAYRDGRTVDFTPLADGIEDDLGGRDFTINAIARPLAGGDELDPFDGRGDIEQRLIRAVRDIGLPRRSTPPAAGRPARRPARLPDRARRRRSSSAATPRSSPGPPVSGSSASSRSCRRAPIRDSPSSGCSNRSAARSSGSTASPRGIHACSSSASSAIRSSDCPFRTSSGDTLAAC